MVLYTTSGECSRCSLSHSSDPKECPCNCSKCGGEKDSEGFCARYCEDAPGVDSLDREAELRHLLGGFQYDPILRIVERCIEATGNEEPTLLEAINRNVRDLAYVRNSLRAQKQQADDAASFHAMLAELGCEKEDWLRVLQSHMSSSRNRK